MIEDLPPDTWQDLQSRVARIFNEIGLTADVDKKLTTPRGEVEIDVYAIDHGSVDQIRYIVECKNWKNPVSQNIVHAFTTVMHESGGNIGFIVSARGFQKGATGYTKNTNIICLSYDDFQLRYLDVWLRRYFAPEVGKAFDSFVQYVEPINCRRDRLVAELPQIAKEQFNNLSERYALFGIGIASLIFPCYLLKEESMRTKNLPAIKDMLSKLLGDEPMFHSLSFRAMQTELIKFAGKATSQFNELFGRDIFK